MQINEKPQVVNEYEQGKAIPNQQIIGKMERALGVKLRGKGNIAFINIKMNFVSCILFYEGTQLIVPVI